jgi:MFS family permease
LSEAVGEAGTAPILRHRPFALFWSARIAATVAFHMFAVAVGWQVYDLTGSALDLGLIGLAQFLPVVLLTLAIGHVADRYDRRAIIAVCQLAEAAALIALALGTLGGWIERAGIFALVALIATARAFESPTMAALVPGLVPRALLPRASAWSASANQTAQIVGPALGGLLYALGPAVVYGSATALLVVAAALIGLIPLERRVAPPAASGLGALFAGIGFVWRDKVILGTLSLDLFAVLLGGATALLPIFARDILGTGPWGLGVLRSAPACGALVMSLVLANRALAPPVGPKLFAALIVFGLATCVFALSTALWLSFAALFTLGAADVVSVVIRFSLVQLRTPDEMRGRVSAVNSLFVGTSNQLGDFESGVLAALIGAVPAVLVGGLGTIAVALLWMRLFPALRRIHAIGD